MTMIKVFEQVIKAHCKSNEYLNDIHVTKALECRILETVKCSPHLRDNSELYLTKYEVTCKMKAKKYEDNIVKFQMNVYSDGSEIGCYFNGTSYSSLQSMNK